MTEQTDQLVPTNVQRANWAKAALTVFTTETYNGDAPEAMHPRDLEDAITDLICDLLHLASFYPRMDVAAIYAQALNLFEQEKAEAESCDCGLRTHGSHHDSQCPVSLQGKLRAPGPTELLEALDALAWSLSPRKVAPVLKAAGHTTDLWLAAHRNARRLIKQAKQ
jgi:hypothetical protein